MVWERERLLTTLKVLADESRLTLLRLLNEREYTVGELAEKLELTEPTISHHLSKLRSAGLVHLRMAGNKRFYRLNTPMLDQFKAGIQTIEQTPATPESTQADDAWIAALNWVAADQQVLREYTHAGKLTQIPAKQKKQIVILRWLATLFEPDRLYSEPEINEILKSVHKEDHVTLRRDLVDFGYLRRERGGGKYWLTPADEFTGFVIPVE